MLRILHNTHIDFLRLWRWSTLFSAALIIPGLIYLAIAGYRYSIEFTGGTLVQVEFQQPPNIGDVRTALSAAGIEGVEIQTFGSPRELVFRAQEKEAIELQAAGAETVAQSIQRVLDERYGENSYTVVRAEAVGPRVGGELRQQALFALLVSFAATLIYLAWRFEWRFSLASVLATVHDILATLAFMKFMNLEISLFVVGGILTVIGYSLNDKVVVFDRVRENVKLHRKMSLYELLNRSVNETLPRTVMTGTTTLATLLALLIFGGEVIRPFAWVLTFGILIGTFSSIYVAGPLLLVIERKWPRERGDTGGIVSRTVAQKSEKPESRDTPESRDKTGRPKPRTPGPAVTR